MLVHVNPASESVGVLSLPRDLWVEIPNYGPGRINTANFLGDSDAYPGGGGPALAMETIAANFGIRVEKYLLVNFDVFTTRGGPVGAGRRDAARQRIHRRPDVSG